MKLILSMAALLFVGCAAPRHAHFNDAPQTQTGQAMAGVMSLDPETLTAEVAPAAVPSTGSHAAGAAAARIDPAPPAKLSRAERKELRKELKSALRQIRQTPVDHPAALSTTPPTEIRTPNPRNNGFAIAGFVLSLVGWFVLWPLVILGLIFSAIGMNSEKRGLATAGLILGVVGIILLLVVAQSANT